MKGSSLGYDLNGHNTQTFKAKWKFIFSFAPLANNLLWPKSLYWASLSEWQALIYRAYSFHAYYGTPCTFNIWIFSINYKEAAIVLRVGGRRRKANNPIKEIKKVVSCEDEEDTPPQPWVIWKNKVLKSEYCYWGDKYDLECNLLILV